MVSHQTKIRITSLKGHFSVFKKLYSIIILIKAKNKNPSNPYFEDPLQSLHLSPPVTLIAIPLFFKTEDILSPDMQ